MGKLITCRDKCNSYNWEDAILPDHRYFLRDINSPIFITIAPPAFKKLLDKVRIMAYFLTLFVDREPKDWSELWKN